MSGYLRAPGSSAFHKSLYVAGIWQGSSRCLGRGSALSLSQPRAHSVQFVRMCDSGWYILIFWSKVCTAFQFWKKWKSLNYLYCTTLSSVLCQDNICSSLDISSTITSFESLPWYLVWIKIHLPHTLYQSSLAEHLELLNTYLCNAAAAAKSLQSCPTLCNSIDSKLPGSAIPGILRMRLWEKLLTRACKLCVCNDYIPQCWTHSRWSITIC